jgi:hypothetical protein
LLALPFCPLCFCLCLTMFVPCCAAAMLWRCLRSLFMSCCALVVSLLSWCVFCPTFTFLILASVPTGGVLPLGRLSLKIRICS